MPLPVAGEIAAAKRALRMLKSEERLNPDGRESEDTLERLDDFLHRKVRRIELVAIDENPIAREDLVVRRGVGDHRDFVPIDGQNLIAAAAARSRPGNPNVMFARKLREPINLA